MKHDPKPIGCLDARSSFLTEGDHPMIVTKRNFPVAELCYILSNLIGNESCFSVDTVYSIGRHGRNLQAFGQPLHDSTTAVILGRTFKIRYGKIRKRLSPI